MRGFTLIELLTGIGLASLIAAAGMAASMDGIREMRIREDREILTDALFRARAKALSGRCAGENCVRGMAYGVRAEPGRFVIFQGERYAERDPDADEALPRASDAALNGDREAAFSAGSGAGLLPGEMIVEDDGLAYAVSVAPTGRITWRRILAP